MFGNRERERKWEKRGKTGKLERKRAESLCPKFYWLSVPFTKLGFGILKSNPLYKITKITSQIFLQSGQKRKKTKRDQKEKTKRAAGNQLGRRNSGEQEEIFQVLQFPYSSTFLAFSALFSFWYLICNAEFDSNSSCLDRLNNFGTISLQKM